MPLSREEIDACFSKQKVRIFTVAPRYALALFLSGSVSVFLLLSYAAIVAGLGFSTYWLGKSGVIWTLENLPGIKLRILAFIFIAAAAFAIAKATFTMVQALFLKAPTGNVEVEIDEAMEPNLLHFIHRIAKSVGAKPPTKVILTGGVDASACMGTFSQRLFGGTRELRLGMCLFPAMTVDTIGGIVAHECGHFSQGIGSRLRSLIYEIGVCFRKAHAAMIWKMYESQFAENYGFSDWIHIMVCKIVASVLKCFSFVAGYFLCLASRQEEFVSDSYQIAFAGSRSLETAMVGIDELHYIYRKTCSECETMARMKKLPENFPGFVHMRYREISELERENVRRLIRNEEASAFSTHPPSKDRIRAAKRKNKPGIFQCKRVGTDLFRDFGERAKYLTFHFYDVECGLQVFTDELIPIEEFAESSTDTKTTLEGEKRFFEKTAQLYCPFPVISTDFEWSQHPTENLVQKFLTDEEPAHISRQRWESMCDSFQSLLFTKLNLSRFEYLVNTRQISLADSNISPQELRSDINQNEAELKEINESLKKEALPAIRRFYLVLNLLARFEKLPNVTPELSAALREMSQLLQILHRFNEAHENLIRTQNIFESMHLIITNQVAENSSMANDNLAARAKEIRTELISHFEDLAVPLPDDESVSDFGKALHLAENSQLSSNSELEQEFNATIGTLCLLWKCKKETIKRANLIESKTLAFSHKYSGSSQRKPQLAPA